MELSVQPRISHDKFKRSTTSTDKRSSLPRGPPKGQNSLSTVWELRLPKNCRSLRLRSTSLLHGSRQTNTGYRPISTCGHSSAPPRQREYQLLRRAPPQVLPSGRLDICRRLSAPASQIHLQV